MAEDKKEETVEETAAKPKSGVMGMVVSGVGIFVVTLAAVVVGGFINNSLHRAEPPEYVLGEDKRITVYVPPPEPGKEKSKKKGKDGKEAPALFFSLDPLVVNFEDTSAVRFLQIGMDLMARDPEAIEELQKHVPLIRNNLLLLISNRDYQKLMTREGKEGLRAEALAEVRKIMKKETGEQTVEDLLFTSFVVQ